MKLEDPTFKLPTARVYYGILKQLLSNFSEESPYFSEIPKILEFCGVDCDFEDVHALKRTLEYCLEELEKLIKPYTNWKIEEEKLEKYVRELEEYIKS